MVFERGPVVGLVVVAVLGTAVSGTAVSGTAGNFEDSLVVESVARLDWFVEPLDRRNLSRNFDRLDSEWWAMSLEDRSPDRDKCYGWHRAA